MNSDKKRKFAGKISITLILLQILFLYLFSNAAERFYYTLHYELFECFYNSGNQLAKECYEDYSLYSLNDLLVGPIHMMLYGLLIAVIIIGIVNRIRKKHLLNTFIVLTLYVLLFLSGIFRFTNELDSLLLNFARFFTHKFWAMNFMVVQIYFISGMVILWLSVKNKYLSKTSQDKIG